jgi:NACHT domain
LVLTISVSDSQDVLDTLDPVTMDASRRTGCLPNTRTDVLKLVVDWANDTRSEQKMLWIRGLAGSGKSALSTTIANTFRDSRQLGAFLFFDRDVTERSNPTNVIRTLAHQLGTSDPRLGVAIRTAIEKNPNITISPLTHQFQKLILEPLFELQLIAPTIVIILDALDECGTKDEREALLTVLAQDFTSLPFFIRTIITSRTEVDICNAFQHQHYIIAYELDITSARNSSDILSYFRHRMTLIRDKRRHLPLGRDWPGDEVLQQLVHRASGLFVWASTATKFIDGHDPRRRLVVVLGGDVASDAETALDALYRTALDSVSFWDDEDFVVDFRAILGIILLAREPLSSAGIDALLGLPEGRPCMNTISSLGCLLQQRPTVRVLHPSFADFLTTKQRCGRDI